MSRVIELQEIEVPAMSTVGTGVGIDIETGERVTFAVDHRPGRTLVDALRYDEEPVEVLVEEFCVLEVSA